MSDFAAPNDPMTLAASDRPLLATLTRWWSPAATPADADTVLGYESAHPWALGDDAAEGNAHY